MLKSTDLTQIRVANLVTLLPIFSDSTDLFRVSLQLYIYLNSLIMHHRLLSVGSAPWHYVGMGAEGVGIGKVLMEAIQSMSRELGILFSAVLNEPLKVASLYLDQ